MIRSFTTWLARRKMMNLYWDAAMAEMKGGLLAGRQRSRALLGRAFDVAVKAGDLNAQGGMLRALAGSYIATAAWQDDWREGIRLYEENVQLAADSGDWDWEFHSRVQIGLVFEMIEHIVSGDDLDIPIPHLESALDTATTFDKDKWRLVAVALLGSALLRQGRQQEALKRFKATVDELDLSYLPDDERAALGEIQGLTASEQSIRRVVSLIVLTEAVGEKTETHDGVEYIHDQYFRQSLRLGKRDKATDAG